MSTGSAIIILPDDRAVTGLKVPLMLWNVMGSPVLAWMIRLMRDNGYGRFLLLCGEEFQSRAMACFPAGSAALSDLSGRAVKSFLSEAQGQLLVVTAPAVLDGRALLGVNEVAGEIEAGNEPDQGSRCYLVDTESIASVCDAANFDLVRFAAVLGHELSWRDGAVPLPDLVTLTDCHAMFNQLRNYHLYADGVEIWDMANCYVGPFAEVAAGAILMPGTILKGNTTVAAGAVIGPDSLLENAAVGSGATVNASQVYNSTVEGNTYVGPFACIRPDSPE